MRFWWVQRFHFLQLYMNNRFLQTPEERLLRRGCQYKMILCNWPKKTLILYYVLLQLTCSCHCCWPSSFLPSPVSSKRAQGFSSEVDILETIRHVFFQRQVCIWKKCARDHYFRENSVCSLIVSVNGSLCIQLFILFYEKKKLWISFLSSVRIISDYRQQETRFAQDMVFEFVHECFVIHISLIRVDIPCSDDCVWHFRH